ncbi:MAG: acyl-CoA thioesterase [Maritimibacter sp.]
MYPFIRMIKELVVTARQPPLPLDGVHISHHICWPWDLDMWMELNNGRTLTIYDLGRIPLARRVGLIKAMTANRWGLTMAGASVMYRKRVRMFDKLEVRSRALGWDDKFVYLEQSMWKGSACTSHILYRTAVTDKSGIVSPARVLDALGLDTPSPELPDWVAGWIEADKHRPWPPQM